MLGLQRRAVQAHDIFELERIDRALDEIVRNRAKSSPPPFQVRSALANAGKVLKERRATAAIYSLEQDVAAGQDYSGCADPGYLDVEYADWIDRAPLPVADQALLRRLVAGDEADALATDYGISEQRMRERISRVRRKARSFLPVLQATA